jgi:hypothetical protein
MAISFIPTKLIKMFAGKFSYAYQSRSANNFSQKRIPKYLIPCSRLNALNHYAAVCAQTQKPLQTFDSSENLNFNNQDFGLTFNKIRKKHKKFHCYDIEQYSNYFWRRLGIKERIHNYGATRVYHFLDNKFFYGEIFFKDNTKIDVETFKKILLEKYLDFTPPAFEGNFQINLADGMIFFEDTGINLSIKYVFTADSSINQKLDEIIDGNSIAEKLKKTALDQIF